MIGGKVVYPGKQGNLWIRPPASSRRVLLRVGNASARAQEAGSSRSRWPEEGTDAPDSLEVGGTAESRLGIAAAGRRSRAD